MEWCIWLEVRYHDAEGWHRLANNSPPHCTGKLYLDRKHLVYSSSYVLTPLVGGTADGSESLRPLRQSHTEDGGIWPEVLAKTTRSLSPVVEKLISMRNS